MIHLRYDILRTQPDTDLPTQGYLIEDQVSLVFPRKVSLHKTSMKDARLYGSIVKQTGHSKIPILLAVNWRQDLKLRPCLSSEIGVQ